MTRVALTLTREDNADLLSETHEAYMALGVGERKEKKGKVLPEILRGTGIRAEYVTKIRVLAQAV